MTTSDEGNDQPRFPAMPNPRQKVELIGPPSAPCGIPTPPQPVQSEERSPAKPREHAKPERDRPSTLRDRERRPAGWRVIAAIVLAFWLLSDIVLVVFMAADCGHAARRRGLGRDHRGISQRTMLALVTVLVVALLAGFLYYLGRIFALAIAGAVDAAA